MKLKGSSEVVKILILTLITGVHPLSAQMEKAEKLIFQPDQTRQTVVGFGASLAYYEGWLNAHPKKAEIYQAIFGELSLDILRVRNAYDYDESMIDRVAEYMAAAENVLGHPISLLSTSWGPPGYLKSNRDRKNGGSLRYTTGPGGVEFDYAGFAHWWNGSLNEYEDHGILPTYISIQNEPDFSASWESCLLSPRETINATDTIAGYNRALDAVFDTLLTRDHRPYILGPETVGIGYNSVENYVNALDLSKLNGIAHHLYHGVDENNPFASADFSKVGNFHPEVPHFQSEYSRGDWFSLAGLIYKSFLDEEVVAYLYWDLIWNTGGLVQLDNPWDHSQWIDPQKGYTKTKEFYAFKQYSAFIHPGWKMASHSLTGTNGVAVTFVSPTGDSAACVFINRSTIGDLTVHIDIPGYRIRESAVYCTSESEDCTLKGTLIDSLVHLVPHSITTVDMRITAYDPLTDTVAPAIPGGASIIDSSSNAITVSWNPSFDSIGVDGYRIYIDGLLLGSTLDTSYTLTGLESGRTYEIAISAFDNAGNESEQSTPIVGTTLYVDTVAPLLEATDSLYQQGVVELVSSEDGMVYLVPESTIKDIGSIRQASIDSIDVLAYTATDLLVSGLENGTYWLYGADTALNLSEPAVLTILGVGIGWHMVHQFKVYPNPFSQTVTFRFILNEEQQIRMTLMDSQGRLVYRQDLGNLLTGPQEVILHRDGLPEGIYLFKLENSRGAGYSGKIVVQD